VPFCRTRSHKPLFSDTSKERYHQCTNINCGCTFVTTEAVERFIVSPGEVMPAPPHPTTSGQQQIRWMWPNKSPANAGLFSMSGQCVEVTRNKFFYFIWLRQKNGLRKGDYTGQGGGSW